MRVSAACIVVALVEVVVLDPPADDVKKGDKVEGVHISPLEINSVSVLVILDTVWIWKSERYSVI